MNDTLIQSISEGEIYNDKNEIIGGLEYYEYFDQSKNELFRLEYNLNTDINIHEDYFYKENKLIYVIQEIYNPKNGKSDTIIIYLKNGKILNPEKRNPEIFELINNAKKYVEKFLKTCE